MLLRQMWENRFRCSWTRNLCIYRTREIMYVAPTNVGKQVSSCSWTRNLCIYRTREIMHVAPTNVGKQVTLLLYTQFTY